MKLRTKPRLQPNPFNGGNAKQRRKQRRSGKTRTTWKWANHFGAIK